MSIDQFFFRSPTPQSTTLFVDKLTRNVTKDHLGEIFGKYGKITNIEIDWDRRANLSRGTATVEFQSRNDAEQAQLHMDGVKKKKTTKVQIFFPQELILFFFF